MGYPKRVLDTIKLLSAGSLLPVLCNDKMPECQKTISSMSQRFW
jgi:hypothetical protein